MQLALEYLAALKNKTRETPCKVDSAINLDLNNNSVKIKHARTELLRSRLQCKCDKWEGLVPTCLDDELGAFVTWEQGDVDTTALHVRRVLVHDGVQLGMAH